MSIEGELHVRLDWTGARVEGVRIRSTRHDAASRVLRGCTAQESLAWIPRVFSICAKAQHAAARLALGNAGAALDRGTGPQDVRREIVDEYFFRLLIDWPRAAGEIADAATVADARRASADVLPELATRRVFGEPPAAWLERRDLDDLDAWTARAGTLPARLLGNLLRESPSLGRSDVALMPESTRQALDRHVLAATVRDPAFAQAPTWDGEPVETGALARMRDHPLVAALISRDGRTAAARMTARLAELAQLVDGRASPLADGWAPKDGEGVGIVETARGLLLHQVRLAGGRVDEYQILAPTEWNFHPQGALARGLRGLAGGDEGKIARLARIAVHALDPCVACSIEVAHA